MAHIIVSLMTRRNRRSFAEVAEEMTRQRQALEGAVSLEQISHVPV